MPKVKTMPDLETTGCPACSGEGVLDCTRCHGSGGGPEHACAFCVGLGTAGECERCRGSGQVPWVWVCALCGDGDRDPLAVVTEGVCNACLMGEIETAGGSW